MSRTLAIFAFVAGLTPLASGAEPSSQDLSRLCANVSSSQAAVACNQILGGRGTDSDRSEALADLGYSYETNGDHNRALESFTLAIETDPKNASAPYARGQLYESKIRDLDHAIADYTRAIELSPKNVRYLEARAELYKQKGQFDLARADTKIAAELDPHSFSAVMSSLEVATKDSYGNRPRQ
jgi:tetratricopeptide (TPR) repeat protein